LQLRKIKIIFAFLMTLAISAGRSFHPEASRADFERWQESARAFVLDALFNGPVPEAVPLSPVFGARQMREGYELTELELHDRPGHTTHCWLARPIHPRAEKLPALIALHGHGGSALMTFEPDKMYFYGDMFARAGYIVLAVDIDHKYLEGIKPWISYQPLPKKVKFPPTGQRVWMVRRAIDFLETDPQVERSKIGVLGLSNGGFTAMFVAAVDQRVGLAISSGSLIMSERMWHSNLLHCRCQYIYKLDRVLDYYDIFALIAPRPLLIQSGEQDPIFPIASAKEAFSYIEKAYATAGASDKLVMDIHNGKHEFRGEAPLKFVQKYFPLPQKRD